MERDQNAIEEDHVFLFEGLREAIRDRAEDLEQFCQSIVRLNIVLVDDPEQHVHDLILNQLPHLHELAIDPMQYGLEVISLTRILTIK